MILMSEKHILLNHKGTSEYIIVQLFIYSSQHHCKIEKTFDRKWVHKFCVLPFLFCLCYTQFAACLFSVMDLEGLKNDRTILLQSENQTYPNFTAVSRINIHLNINHHAHTGKSEQEDSSSDNEVQKLSKQDEEHTTVRCLAQGLFSDVAVPSFPVTFLNLCAL